LSQPIPAPYPSFGPPAYGPPAGPPPRKGAGLAIASMVLGIIALLLSWVPIINNLAAVLALVGLGLGIPGLIRARRGTHAGSGMAITGIVTSALALVVVVLTQMFFAKVIDEVDRSLDESISQSGTAAEPTTVEDVDSAPQVVPLGTPAPVGDYQVSVDGVELDGNATVAAGNQFNEPPTGQYVVVQVTATYTGTQEGAPGFDLAAVFHGTDSRQYSDSDCMQTLPDDAMDAPTLNPGGADTFQFCMDVPPAAIAGGQLSIEPLMSFDSSDRVFYAIG
jgi:hypothetical protein